jgi:hypothetical protein
MWFQVELPARRRIAEIQFDSVATRRQTTAAAPGAPAAPGPAVDPAVLALANNGFPRSYSVQVSIDGRRWSTVVADGKGTGPRTIAAFTPVDGKFIRITATDRGVGLPPWSITNLRLFEQ